MDSERNHVKKLLLLISFLVSCANKVDVPSEVKVTPAPQEVNVNGIPSEIRVIHVVEISAQMGQIFNKECSDLAIVAGLSPDTPEYKEFVDNCVLDKSNQFIKDFMALIQQQQSQQTGQ